MPKKIKKGDYILDTYIFDPYTKAKDVGKVISVDNGVVNALWLNGECKGRKLYISDLAVKILSESEALARLI